MQYIDLDGDSLTTEDLVNLGKGYYKIKVWGWEGKDVLCLFFCCVWKSSVCSALTNCFPSSPQLLKRRCKNPGKS